jgi:hypothetical protein
MSTGGVAKAVVEYTKPLTATAALRQHYYGAGKLPLVAQV